MRNKLALLSMAIFLSIVFAGCGGPVSNSNTATNTANANSNPLETNKAAPEQLVNNGPTLTPVFKAYCSAWVKNDEAALRKVYSADEIKNYEEDLKTEKKKSLIKMLEGTDRVKESPCEVRNEKITGDKAIATIVSSRNPNGIQVVFVKENGEWKMTNQSPTIDAVVKSTPAATTAK